MKEQRLDPFQVGIVIGLLWRESNRFKYNFIEEFILKTFMPKTYKHNMMLKKAYDDIGNQMWAATVFIRKEKIERILHS
jgi:hypothetical protein